MDRVTVTDDEFALGRGRDSCDCTGVNREVLVNKDTVMLGAAVNEIRVKCENADFGIRVGGEQTAAGVDSCVLEGGDDEVTVAGGFEDCGGLSVTGGLRPSRWEWRRFLRSRSGKRGEV